MSRGLARLRDLVAADGGLLADELGELGEPATARIGAGPGAIAAAGPRASGAAAEYELLVEAIYEGYLLHYATTRLLETADPDLALLAGDRLYALGLERLVALGDIPAVIELADVISLCALCHARGQGELAESIWEAGARAVGWGVGPAYALAKSLLMAGDEQGPGALRAAGTAVAGPSEQAGR